MHTHARALAASALLLLSFPVACSAEGDGTPPSLDASSAAPEEHVLASHLVIAAEGVETAARRAEALTRSREGVVEHASVTARAAELTLRVPSESLPDLETDLAALGELRSRERTSEDVTVTHAEMRARIDVRLAERARLAAMLESSTNSLGDVLEVERELTRVTEGLDVLEATERALATRVALARIDVTLVPRSAVSPPTTLAGAALEGVTLAGSLAYGTARVALTLGPSALVLGLALALVRWVRRWAHARRVAAG